MSTRDELAFGITPTDRRYKLRYARYPALAEAIAAHVATSPCERLTLLDLGVGSGKTVPYLAAAGIAARFEFLGVDLHPKPGRLLAADRWKIVQADLEEGIPFADGCADIAVCEQVVEHLHDPRSLIGEIERVLRPGGLLVLGAPIFPPVLVGLRRWIVPLREWLSGYRGDHVQAFTKRSLAALVQSSGGLRVFSTRGFRIISGGIISPLEDLRAWWRLNQALGRALPSVCIEVQILATKIGAGREPPLAGGVPTPGPSTILRSERAASPRLPVRRRAVG